MKSEIKSLIHEKIFKRPDGSRVKITVLMEKNYHVSVHVCPPKKRSFTRVDVTDDYRYRNLPFGSKQREGYEMAELSKHCTASEIQEVALELWQASKPDFIGKFFMETPSLV